MRRAILLLTLVGAVMFACAGVVLAQQNDTPTASQSQSERFAPDRVIVKLEEGASSSALEERNRGIGARTEKRIAPRTVPRLHTVKLPRGQSVERAIQHYEASRNVEYAEPDFFVYHDQTPTDHQTPTELYYTNNSLWGLNNTGKDPTDPEKSLGTEDADIDAPEAWELTNADEDTEIVVGVIDEGVQHTHPDLEGNIWVNTKEDQGTSGVDDDGNGKIDDVHGWDFYYNDNSTYDGSADDHGTHVAGTIGALANGEGVVGVVNHSKVKLITAKFLGPNGGYTSGAIQAVDYLTDLKKNRGISNLKITSNSWGGGGYSQGLYDAIKRANTEGILFVAAAGNSGANNDSYPHFPSSYGDDAAVAKYTNPDLPSLPNVIAVAATDRYDAKASWSNYGVRSVDLGAPGVSILSTLPNGTYGSYSGTSMATPHVSGVAALLMSGDSNLTHLQAKNLIFQEVDPVSSLAGKTVTGGRLKALGDTPPDTIAPTVSSVSPSNAATGVARSTNVTATFSEAMDEASVEAVDPDGKPTNFTLEGPDGSAVDAEVSYDAETEKATLDPAAELQAGTKYTATVKGGPNGAKDKAGNPLAADKVWSFTVSSDRTAPKVKGTSPSDKKTGVSRGSNVTASFSEAIDKATLRGVDPTDPANNPTFTLVLRDDGGTPPEFIEATVTPSSDGKKATLNPSGNLGPCTWYEATVTTDVKDKAGNALDQNSTTAGNQPKTWTFRTSGC